METAALLKRTALFAGLSDRAIKSVLGTAKEKSFEEGAVVVDEGHEGGRGFYMVLEGGARVTVGGTEVAKVGPGDYFGEMALLLEDTPRTAEVVATSDLKCLIITQWDLKSLITTHPEIAITMLAELARRLRDTDAKLRE